MIPLHFTQRHRLGSDAPLWATHEAEVLALAWRARRPPGPAPPRAIAQSGRIRRLPNRRQGLAQAPKQCLLLATELRDLSIDRTNALLPQTA